ncbi:hypothetical protein DRP07_00340 [Archaeoglobales archaeon]|nr:MAG: hypothetical protein DRP07_00340 [Archaeoglobales archaeon]
MARTKVKNDTTVLDYINHLQNSGRESAANTYGWILKGFARRRGKEIDELTWADFKPNAVKEHLAKLKNNQTRLMFLSAARGFMKYLRDDAIADEEYIIYSRMCDALQAIRIKSSPMTIYRKALTMDELAAVLESISDEFLYNAVVVHFYLGNRPVELSHPFSKEKIDLEELRTKPPEPKRIVDFDNGLISIITAKTKAQRIIPIHDKVHDNFKYFFDHHHIILRWSRPREWLTKHLKKLSIYVTSKTARYTFETLMTARGLDDRFIKYWLGHTSDIANVYRDFTILIRDISTEINQKHFILELI